MPAYISHITYLTNRMGSISHHITPLVINSLGGGDTHTRILSRTEEILRNQTHASSRPVRAWFNKIHQFCNKLKNRNNFCGFQSLESKPVSSNCLNSNYSGLERLLLAHAISMYIRVNIIWSRQEFIICDLILENRPSCHK